MTELTLTLCCCCTSCRFTRQHELDHELRHTDHTGHSVLKDLDHEVRVGDLSICGYSFSHRRVEV